MNDQDTKTLFLDLVRKSCPFTIGSVWFMDRGALDPDLDPDLIAHYVSEEDSVTVVDVCRWGGNWRHTLCPSHIMCRTHNRSFAVFTYDRALVVLKKTPT